MIHKRASGQDTDYFRRATRQREAQEESEILTEKDDELEHGFYENLGKDKHKTAAYLRKLAKQGDLDNVVRNAGYETKGGGEGSEPDYVAFLQDVLGDVGGFKGKGDDYQDAYRLGEDLGKLAEANG